MFGPWHDDTLGIRLATPADLEDFSAMLADDEVCRWLWFGPNTPEQTHAYFDPLVDAQAKAVERGELPAAVVFVATDPTTGGFVGHGAAVAVDGSPGGYEIGYALAQSSWGRGLGSRLGRFLVAYAVRVARAHRLEACVLSGNAASGALLRGLGLQLEGTRRQYRSMRGVRCDEDLFGAVVAELDLEAVETWADAFGIESPPAA